MKNMYNNSPTEKNLSSLNQIPNIYQITESKRRNGATYRKSENSIMQSGLNLISPKYKKDNYISFNNDDNKYNENYLHSAENLKGKFDSPVKSIINSRIGLKYDQIPRISTEKKNDNVRLNLLFNKMENSLKYKKGCEEMFNIDEVIDKENEKLRFYLNNAQVFFGQNDRKFPNLIELQRMGKLKHQNLIVSGNRYMGEKYDPLNYD